MKTVSIHDAKTNLSQYIAAAKRGEQVFIGSFGKAEVMLTAIGQADASALRKRSFAVAKGKVVDAGEAFTDTADAELAARMTDAV